MWTDEDSRPQYLAKSHAKLSKFRDLRKQDPGRYKAKASALWKHAEDARPMLYRHLLLEALSSTGDSEAVAVPDGWLEAVTDDALRAAKQLFHDVYSTCLLYTSPSPRDRG